MSAKSKGIVSIILSAFGFALMAACVRLCDDFGEPIPCFEKSFFRNAVALILALVPLLRLCSAPRLEDNRKSKTQKTKESLLILLRSIFGTIGIFANFYALSHIPIADGQTLNKTAPFFTVLFTALFLREKVCARQIGAVLVGFLGAVLVVKPGFAGDCAFPLVMGLLGGLCAGAAYATVRALGKLNVAPPLIVFAFSAFSCLASLPLACVTYVPLTFAQLLILGGAGLGAAIGQFGITFAYRFAAPREIAVYDYSNILFTAAFGYLLFEQLSDPLALLGMLTIILAAFILNTRKPQTFCGRNGA